MGEGKLNYERQKARVDMAAQIHEASQIRKDRERDMIFIFAGACLMRGAALIRPNASLGTDFTAEATAMLQQAKERATEINKEPDTSEFSQ